MLGRVKPPAGSSFDPDPKNCCMPDTRTDVIESLVSFALSEESSPRLFLLSGVAGSGKSAVATSVANSLHQRRSLSGSFFFKRDVEKLRIPANLIHAVAYSIAQQYKPYMDVLMNTLKSNPAIEDAALSLQFDALLKGPLNEISNTSSTNLAHPSSNQPCVTFIVDALDECDDPQLVSSYLVELVGLAPWLKVIVTCRPLDDIEADLCSSGNMTYLNLFTVDASEDILKFTRSRFAPGGLLHRLQSRVTEEEIQALADKSHGLFIWIKTVLSYIASLSFDGVKVKEMRSILSSSTAASPEKGVDQLYLRVLRMAGDSSDSQDAVKNFVGFICATSRNKPLPCDGLHAFVPTSDSDIFATPEDIDDLRRKLAAVIFMDPDTDALRVCHPSFLDFIASQARSQEFWTDSEVLDTMMAQRCFAIMTSGLKFNICGLESSRQRNDEIPDLQRRISEELQYSAVYWLDHLSRSSGSSNDAKLKVAYEFLYHARLFYWLEVLSVVSKVNVAAQILQELVVMSKVCSCTLSDLGGHH